MTQNAGGVALLHDLGFTSRTGGVTDPGLLEGMRCVLRRFLDGAAREGLTPVLCGHVMAGVGESAAWPALFEEIQSRGVVVAMSGRKEVLARRGSSTLVDLIVASGVARVPEPEREFCAGGTTLVWRESGELCLEDAGGQGVVDLRQAHWREEGGAPTWRWWAIACATQGPQARLETLPAELERTAVVAGRGEPGQEPQALSRFADRFKARINEERERSGAQRIDEALDQAMDAQQCAEQTREQVESLREWLRESGSLDGL